MFNVSDQTSSSEINEIEQYQSARWISPPEAAWRIFRFSLGDMKPAVIQLQVHLENYQPINFNHKHKLENVITNPLNKKTMLTEFFFMNKTNLHAKQRNHTYGEFPDSFVWEPDRKKWKVRNRGNPVGRIVIVNPIEGERYYLKLLLSKVKSPKSFCDLKNFRGKVFSSYHDSALARGYLEEDNSQENCLNEAAMYHMPYELRRLFATLLVYCSPKEPLKLWEQFEMPMSEDIAKQPHLSKDKIKQIVLQQINTFLQSMGKDLGSFNLIPAGTNRNKFEDSTKELRCEQNIIVSEADINSRRLFNVEQEVAFNQITESIYKNKPECFFIDGPGGTGKTFLYRALLASVRIKGHIALATATSGIAASLLPGGRTAHSRFKIPIDLEPGSTCRISKQTSLAQMIREAKLIIWDEAPMSKRNAIEALDDLLKDLMNSSAVFGGKVVVLGGDFRQILPVVPQGTKSETINASIIQSNLWPKLTKLRLVENMRARLDPAFTKFLLQIGEGQHQTHDSQSIELPMDIVIKNSNSNNTLKLLIDAVFPDFEAFTYHTGCYINKAILTTKNIFVDEINEQLIQQFPGVETEYISFDQTLNPDDQGQYEDMLNSLTPNGLPPHKLILKPNAPIILLRNLDPSEGLCNGTRLICKQLEKNVIHAEIAIGDHAGKPVFIHRIPLRPTNGEFTPIPYKRIQFPIRLCFAMTINKSQGQTLDFVGVYLKEPVFSHGQLYVALSRAKTACSVKVLIAPTFFESEQKNKTKNIVYKEVLMDQP